MMALYTYLFTFYSICSHSKRKERLGKQIRSVGVVLENVDSHLPNGCPSYREPTLLLSQLLKYLFFPLWSGIAYVIKQEKKRGKKSI